MAKAKEPKPVYEWSGDDVSVVRVIDGDTVVLRLSRTYTLNVDFGFHIRDLLSLAKATEVHLRLFGCNAPEVVGPEKAQGLRSKAALEHVLGSGSLRVQTLKPDKYGGRYLAQIWVTPKRGTEKSVNQHMIDGGFAKTWDGQGKKPK